MEIAKLIAELSKIDWLAVLGAISAICTGLIVIFSLIPGDQPEKFLKVVVDVIGKFSRKK
jgi:hypothetical protein